MTPAARASIQVAVTAAGDRAPAGATLVGVGWATVELERASRELGLAVTDAPDDLALGARCRSGMGDHGTPVILLEPSTEGRLAASLARLGEGPHVTWWDVDESGGTTLLGPLPGPLGPARLVRDGRHDGRWLFLRERGAATIRG